MLYMTLALNSIDGIFDIIQGSCDRVQGSSGAFQENTAAIVGYRMAKTHQMPYFSMSLSAKEPGARGDGAL